MKTSASDRKGDAVVHRIRHHCPPSLRPLNAIPCIDALYKVCAADRINGDAPVCGNNDVDADDKDCSAGTQRSPRTTRESHRRRSLDGLRQRGAVQRIGSSEALCEQVAAVFDDVTA